MVIQLFPGNRSFPEFFFGRREGKLFIELDPQNFPTVSIQFRGKRLPYAVVKSIVAAEDTLVRRYQVLKPGTYPIQFGPDELMRMRISVNKCSTENIYDVAFESEAPVSWCHFVGNTRINGIKLSSLSQKEEEPTVGPTFWERLDVE